MKNFSVILITSLAQNLFANGFTTLSPGVLLKTTALVDGMNTCKRNTARIGRSTKATTLKESIATGLEESFSSTEEKRKKRIVVVGGGWAGYSFCESISQNDDVEIILLDASKQARVDWLVGIETAAAIIDRSKLVFMDFGGSTATHSIS